MKKNVSVLPLFSALFLLLFSACQKEFSFETSSTPSSGSLQAEASGDCLPKTVEGIYEVGTVLDAATNYIDVQVNITEAGSYHIYSDTVNGIFFQAKGTFAIAGLNTVRLTGDGTPLSAGIHNFTITYDSSQCKVAVSTLPQGAAGPAVFTLAVGPTTCLDYTLSGIYVKDIPLTAANTVAIKVNVTTIGTYTITTQASKGIIFAGSGALSALGEQIITLTATGTPVATGKTNIEVKAGSSSCSFPLDVAGPAAFAVDCTSAVANGTYEEGIALAAANTVDIDVNVTTPGAYSITTTAVNGMTFSGAGNFVAAGSQTITLTGSGTPTADGTFDITIPGGCAFEVTVDPGAPAADMIWKFTSGTTTYQGPTDDAEILSGGGITYVAVSGASSAGLGAIGITLSNSAGAITTGDYSGTAITGKFNAFSYNDGSVLWIAGPGAGAAVTVKLITYNTTTHIIEGTFSGNAKDGSGAIVPITAGSFKAILP